MVEIAGYKSVTFKFSNQVPRRGGGYKSGDLVVRLSTNNPLPLEAKSTHTH
jgi:hypothetical protein